MRRRDIVTLLGGAAFVSSPLASSQVQLLADEVIE
jgi:hypothetical protein